MAKVQVYLPDALHEQVRKKLPELNVSALLQQALEEQLSEVARRKALDASIRSYERAHGKITRAEADAVLAEDRVRARRPNAPRPKKRAA